MLYFQNERRCGARNVYNDLFLGHFQTGVDKGSEDLAILILEFDVFVEKTLYSPPKRCYVSEILRLAIHLCDFNEKIWVLNKYLPLFDALSQTCFPLSSMLRLTLFLYSVLSSRGSSETRIRQNSGLVVSGCCLVRNDVWFGKNDFALLQITYWLNIKAPLRLGYCSNLSDRKLTQKVNNILFLLIVTPIKKMTRNAQKE